MGKNVLMMKKNGEFATILTNLFHLWKIRTIVETKLVIEGFSDTFKRPIGTNNWDLETTEAS